MKGKFITFEGIEGSGKDTQIEILSHSLRRGGVDVVVYREPGSTVIGSDIRKILLNPDNTNLCSESELLLYYAARAQLIHEKIMPDLYAGKIVICNRYDDSSRAYQHYGRGIDLDLLDVLRANFVKVVPDLTILLDLPIELGLSRSSTDEFGRPDRFESERFDFHERVRYGYLEMARSDPERFRVVDASMLKYDVFLDVYHHVASILK